MNDAHDHDDAVHIQPSLGDTRASSTAHGSPSALRRSKPRWRQVPWSDDQLVRSGANGAARGLSLQETIHEYATSKDHNANSTVGQRLERAAIVASGWFEASVPHEGIDACTDSATGLGTPAYLRARLLDVHRKAVANRRLTSRGVRHNLIVIAPPTGDISAPETDLGVVARAVQPHLESGMTAARCGPRSVVIVCEAGHDAPSLLRAIRAALVANSSGHWRVWSEPVVGNATFLGAQLHEIALTGREAIAQRPMSLHPSLERSATHATQGTRRANSRALEEIDDVRNTVNANAPIDEVLGAFAVAWHGRAATFDEVVAELRSIRELILPAHVARFDHANTIAAICGPWERDAGQVELSAARDHLTGLSTGAYLARRLQELAPQPLPSAGEPIGPTYVRCDVTLTLPATIADLGPRLRLARSVQRIFESAELVAGPSRDTITIVVSTDDQYDEGRRRLDLLLAETWACAIVVNVQEEFL